MAIVAGIDGCPAGWVCVIKDQATGVVHSSILARISDLLHIAPAPNVVMIDMPTGLMSAGPRQCEVEARSLLRWPRSSSVFSAPIRPMLSAATYAQACQIGLAADGRKLSRQAWNIVPKIREVDSFLQANIAWQSIVHEVHPELSFWAWNGRQAMHHGKKSPLGRAEREALVRPVYASAYPAAQALLPRRQYANDDLLDAFAALWTGERVATGQHLVLPANPPTDACGLPVRIVV